MNPDKNDLDLRLEFVGDLVFLDARHGERAIVIDINTDHARQAELSGKNPVRQADLRFCFGSAGATGARHIPDRIRFPPANRCQIPSFPE